MNKSTLKKKLDMFRTMRGNSQYHYVHDEAIEKETSIECMSKIAFLQTDYNHPQLPHVDYPWNYLDKSQYRSRNKVFTKPAIVIFPLTNEGMMINFWLKSSDSKGNVESKPGD